jgi:serine/threonine-protein kinase
MAQDTELGGHVVSGTYRLVRRVGDSVPALYEARHPRLSGRFAARLWSPTMPWDAFRRGAEVAATLRHPGVLQVIDFNCEPGAPPFLVTEWIDGLRLSDVMASSGLLPVARVATLVESAAWALASAHQQGVVHQELRPADIYVIQAPGSTREWTKLDGFGVAAALARAGATPPSPYRAPEQGTAPESAEAADGADPLSDQFALAAIAYEMLAGVHPFEAPAETTEGQPAAPPAPTPLMELAPDVTAAVDVVIQQALAREPEERFAGVLEFAQALRDAAQGASTQVVRRRKVEAAARARTKKVTAEGPVSPFFNPVQAQPVEGRRLWQATGWSATLARLVPPMPRSVPARAGVLLGVLVALFVGAWVVLREPARRGAPTVAAAPAPRAPAIAPARPTPPPAPPEPPVTVTAVLGTTRVAPEVEPLAAHAAADPPPPPVLAVKRARPRAGSGRQAVAATPAAGPAGGGGGPCVISVVSKPWANVWLDEHNTGHRTPLSGFHLPCGDHKLVLKRDDLDIYQMEVITVRNGIPFKKSYPLQ